MAFDGFFCVAVSHELNKWAGARVDKLHFSSPSSLCLSLYQTTSIEGARASSRANLLISATASNPVIAISGEDVLRPEQPTGQCMLFRKHLINAHLVSVSCVQDERILCFEFNSADEMGYLKKRFLYAEMMGKYSNILLCNEENRILGASSVADITASVRQVMVGMPYELPPKQDKTSLSAAAASKELFFSLLAQNEGKRADNFLVSTFFAFSPLVAREIVFRTCGRVDVNIFELEKEKFYNEITRLSERIEKKEFTPVLVRNKEGEGIEYSFLPIEQYTTIAKSEEKESFSQLLTEYYGKKSEVAGIKQYAFDILKVVNNALTKFRKKIVLQQRELAECRKRDTYKTEGDLITAYMYRLKQGDTKVLLYDYESEKEVEIVLDARLTPAKNAQNRYKKYAKLKHAEGILQEQIAKAETEISYLESVLDFIMRSSNVQELGEIRKELVDTGYIAGQTKGKKQRSIPMKPLTFTTSGGLTIKVGKNNKENDSLTASADKWDLWFHIKGFHGSHVILYTNGEEPSSEEYTEAARIAAYHSEKRGSENVGVDYTQVRYLKKPKGSPPGFITYDKYWTAFVDATLPK